MSIEQPEIVPPNKKYTNHGLVGSVKKLYLDEKSSDIKFLFGSDDDGTSTCIASSVVAHKNLLAAASDVFDAMFYGDLKEKGDIRLTDSSEAAFIEFLQFFYLNEVELTEENIGGVLHLGQKYNVTQCVAVCNQFLMDLLTIDNIFVILDLATTYDQYELLKFCEKFIILDTAAVLKSASFLECDRKNVAHLLKMGILSCTEAELFEACMLWIKAKSGQDSAVTREVVKMHLGELFYQIRFASMTTQDVCQLTDKYNLVLRDDFMTITKMIAIKEFQPNNFNTLPRQAEWNADADAVIKCSFKNGNEWKYSFLKTQQTIFSASEPLLLGGFTCGKIKVYKDTYRFLSSDLSVDVEVFESDDVHGESARVLLEMKANLQSMETKITLSRPVLIRPGFFYGISLGPFPEAHVFYSDILKTKMEIQSTIKFNVKLHNCSTSVSPEDFARHGKAIGLIGELEFNNI